MDTFGKRIENILTFSGLGKKAFAEEICKIRRQSLDDIISGKTKAPGIDLIINISDYFKGKVNLTWLITGKGDMIITEKGNTAIAEPAMEEYWRGKYSELLNENENLFKANEENKKRISEQSTLIDLLKTEIEALRKAQLKKSS